MTRSTNTSPIPEESIAKPTVLNQDHKDIIKKYQQVKQHIQNTLASLQKDTGTSSEKPDDSNKPEHSKSDEKHLEESPPTAQEEESQTEDTEVPDTDEDSDHCKETDADSASECIIIPAANTDAGSPATMYKH